MKVLVLTLLLLLPSLAQAQEASPLYRVFLADGTALSSFGEWARVDDCVIFSLPVTAGNNPDQLHLVSLPAARVDWRRTEQYADAVRARRYAADRGEEEFARLSADVARIVNEVALVKDPTERLVFAERARRSLADWPGKHYGYRAKDVHQMVGVLDEVIGGLRAAAGLGQFDLALTATTMPPPPPETVLAPPDHKEIVEQLLAAATLVSTPAEKISLLQTVLGVLDRAVQLLPEAWAATVRSTALAAIAEERKIDVAYTRLRDTTLTSAARFASRADIRSLERLRLGVKVEDGQLGRRRPDEMSALAAAIDVHLEAAHRLRLAQDQWMLRLDRLRAYQRAASASVTVLTRAQSGLDDIRALAGPPPLRLRTLVEALGRESRILSRIDPPAELAAIHALFRSAGELALNAAQLRLDAVAAADLELARRASSAAAGAIMLLTRARADLDAAMRPPLASASAQ
jgi:hypothetical protein